ncbi:MAG: nitric-oxide reductase large subunit [Ignavibacteriales bacterium]|nr:nitric-oxide reductase large subunit [Ignavibacteriales bacterium]
MKKLWILFWSVIAFGFAVLGWAGWRIYQEKPPLPAAVVTTDGRVIISEGEVSDGQNVWQAMGGMELGSVWGHGSYVAPDWTADWLHRECIFILNSWSNEKYGKEYTALDGENQSMLQSRLQELMRTNTYDASTGKITIEPVRARAIEANTRHFSQVFSEGNDHYAIPQGAVSDPAKLRQISAFFFWTSWAASTNRPGDDITYTSNWPHEELVNNRPTPDAVVWTGVSIILLLAGIGGMVWYHASRPAAPAPDSLPASDPLFGTRPTPSQRATLKYFWTVSALILVQIGMGVVTAHYGVEGGGFYGIPLSKWIPYVLSRTWHVQLGIFWIATAWLAAGLYIVPVVCGNEPNRQKLGVDVLFGALLLVVVGSFVGEALSIHNKLSGDWWFYLGHQGYEYVDLGRVWQIALSGGLAFWVFLVARGIVPAIRRGDEHKSILMLFLIATVAIGGFYFAGLMWGQRTNLSIVEYWRWWVVHLWVEGFFEVFATVVIIFMFTRLKLIRPATGSAAVLLSSAIYLAGGIIGTLHHLYFSGTPTAVLALGAVFSALEVVPLVLAGFEAWENVRLSRSAEWVSRYKWPVYFFISVAFWNMVGAGLFGFMINPPIALYYMQGLNTTPLHGHAALFGVYGMLGIGLMLFCLRILWVQDEWKEKMLGFSFWSLNVGLMAMVVISLLPVGLLQTWASVKYGYWYARSAEFLATPVVQSFKWSRVFGDTIFAIGSLALVLFVVGLVTGHSLKKK